MECTAGHSWAGWRSHWVFAVAVAGVAAVATVTPSQPPDWSKALMSHRTPRLLGSSGAESLAASQYTLVFCERGSEESGSAQGMSPVIRNPPETHQLEPAREQKLDWDDTWCVKPSELMKDHANSEI